MFYSVEAQWILGLYIFMAGFTASTIIFNVDWKENKDFILPILFLTPIVALLWLPVLPVACVLLLLAQNKKA